MFRLSDDNGMVEVLGSVLKARADVPLSESG